MTAAGTLRGTARTALLALCVLGIGANLWAGIRYDRLSDALTMIPVLTFAGVGLLLSLRLPGNPIGWVFLGVAAATALIGTGNALSAYAYVSDQQRESWAIAVSWTANFMWVIVVALGFPLTLLLFPHGLPSARWRPVLWATVVSTAVTVLLGMLSPELGFPEDGITVANPLHPHPWGRGLDLAWVGALVTLSICCFLALAAAVQRFRRARGEERAQMRWLAFSACFLVVVLFVPGLNNSNLAFAIAFSLVPASCGIAILRYHLYEIDRIVSRTTSYAIVTGVVLATYAVVVTLVLRLLPDASSLAVASATLAAAAVARPAVRRVQRTVDRRFDRTRYDQETIAGRFGDQVRVLVRPEDVTSELLSAVRSALQPARSGMWSPDSTR